MTGYALPLVLSLSLSPLYIYIYACVAQPTSLFYFPPSVPPSLLPTHLLVPASTTTPVEGEKPSISTSSWFSVFSRSSLPPEKPREGERGGKQGGGGRCEGER